MKNSKCDSEKSIHDLSPSCLRVNLGEVVKNRVQVSMDPHSGKTLGPNVVTFMNYLRLIA